MEITRQRVLHAPAFHKAPGTFSSLGVQHQCLGVQVLAGPFRTVSGSSCIHHLYECAHMVS